MWATRVDFCIKSADMSTYSPWTKEGIGMSAEDTTVELFQHRTGVPDSLGGPPTKQGWYFQRRFAQAPWSCTAFVLAAERRDAAHSVLGWACALSAGCFARYHPRQEKGVLVRMLH